MSKVNYDAEITPEREVVGTRIRILRERLGLTQEKLAARLGIASSRLSHYEVGRRPLPVDVATDLARIAKVSLDHLFSGKRVSK